MVRRITTIAHTWISVSFLLNLSNLYSPLTNKIYTNLTRSIKNERETIWSIMTIMTKSVGCKKNALVNVRISAEITPQHNVPMIPYSSVRYDVIRLETFYAFVSIENDHYSI